MYVCMNNCNAKKIFIKGRKSRKCLIKSITGPILIKNKFLRRILLLVANQLNNNINKNLGAKEMSQKLKTHIALEENLHLVHSTLLNSSITYNSCP